MSLPTGEKLLAERGIQLPKAPSRAQREAAIAAAAAVPVPVAVSEGDVATRQGPLSQPGKKDTSASEPALAESREQVPSSVPNKGTSAPTVRQEESEGNLLVNNDEGNLLINNDKGNLLINNDKGNLLVNNDEGNLLINNDEGNLLVNNDKGNLLINNDEGNLLVNNDEGNLLVNNDEGNLLVNNDEGNLLVNNDEGNLLVNNDEENLLVNKDEENLLVNKDEENLLVNKDEENLLINKDEENLLVSKDEENLLVNKDENLELAVQYVCCTALRDACKELQEDLEESLSNEGTRQEDEKMSLEEEKADEKWLEKTALILSSNAIREACSKLCGEMVPSCDTLSGQNIHLPHVSIRDAVTGCDENEFDRATQQPLHQEKPSIEEEALENGIEQKVTAREERMENFHEEEKNNIEEKEQTQTKTKKGWKARGQRAARRLGRAVSRLLTSCCRSRVDP
ncbi:PREDICTED: putative histone-lysine N-methyltransferase 1 [Branchiostoma belcheri]|uniref:Histone-lysine N-methyltransferase 1 n=1 Tax=Branchiostoma belcheri TaxID=7741 RepID=A0A6P4YVT0_BRABE|nr:PREDICTED: putative histone-lysine N-methyltransferase 1 [Branchiostoma belcheri]